jgi:hypothetical protein
MKAEEVGSHSTLALIGVMLLFFSEMADGWQIVFEKFSHVETML